MEHLVETRSLVGDVVVDAIGAAEDKREELERQRTESMAGRGIAGRGMAGRANYASSIENKYATKQQIAMLLGLGRDFAAAKAVDGFCYSALCEHLNYEEVKCC